MIKKTTRSIRIDLKQFKLHLYLQSNVELTLHFDSPSRRFYLSVIAFVVQEMKKRGRITPIPLQKYIDTLALLNETVGGAAGSSKKEYLLSRIYRKWKDALPDLENAPLFKVVGRKKRYDELMDKVYRFSEGEKDKWANLFEYSGSHEQVRLRFSVDRLGSNLDDVIIVYGEHLELETVDAWERFIADLKDTEEDKPELPISRQNRWYKVMRIRWRWMTLCLLIVFVSGVATYVIRNTNLFAPKIEVASVEKMLFPLPDKPSIAILPFRNLSDDPKQDYFSDGITEEIINGLSKISSLFVIAANSMLTYNGEPVEVRQVSEELGVRYVLESTVRKIEDQLRITTRLIDAVAGHYLWSERYDRELKDIFAIQDEITIKILTALQVELLAGDKSRLQEKQTHNLQAYLKIFEGRSHWYDFDFDTSTKSFEEARNLDPLYAEAYANEAFAHLRNHWFGPPQTRWHSFVSAIEPAKKCAEINSDLASCNMVMGLIHLVNREDLDAVSKGKRAVEICPNSSEALIVLAVILRASGRYEEALRQIEKALRLDPFRPLYAWSILGVTYFDMGRYEDSIKTCKKIVKLYPNALNAYMILALAYGSKGRIAEARSAVNNILRIRPNFSSNDFTMIFFRKTEKDIDSILHGLLETGSN